MRNTDNPFGRLGITAKLALPYGEALARAKAALKEEGFGVLTEVDVREILKDKIDVEFRPYAILGVCNPKLAHQALMVTPAVGLMLPCNVVVEETDGGSVVSAMDPEAGLAAVGEEGLQPVAKEAKERLSRAIASLKAFA
ncbi:MAG TPA: DUF302 domain-containing protein [Armatimonadota bacterium]|jgi:uncharacterized protein (DUF302 family)